MRGCRIVSPAAYSQSVRLSIVVLFLVFLMPEMRAQMASPAAPQVQGITGLSVASDRKTAVNIGRSGLDRLNLGVYQGLSQRADYTRDPGLAFGGLSLEFPRVNVGVDMDLALDLASDVSLDLARPFFRSAPNDPLFELGLFYLDMGSVTGQVLMSDNADQTTTNRKAGAISVLQVQGITGGIQIGRFGFNIEGDLIILPFEGKMGLSGFGIDEDIYDIVVNTPFTDEGEAVGTPQSWASLLTDFAAGANYEFDLGNWTVHLQDTATISGYEVNADYRNEWLENALWDSLDQEFEERLSFYYPDRTFTDQDELGGYSFGGMGGGNGKDDRKTGLSRESDEDDNTDDDTDDEEDKDDDDDERDVMLENRFSATLIQSEGYPWQPWFTYRRTNERVLYSNSDEEEDKPSWEESYTLGFRSVSDARFRPYWYYTAIHDSDEESFDHTTRLGMTGPLSHYTTFNGNVGWAWDADNQRDWLYQIGLQNCPRPMTRQDLQVVRYFTEEDRELTDEIRYVLSQSLGPRVTASFITSWSDTVTRPEESENTRDETLQTGLGLRFRSTSGRFTLRIRGILDQNRADDNDENEGDEWRFILNARYMLFQRAFDSLWVAYRWEWEDDRAIDDRDWESRFDIRYRHTFKREFLRSRMAFDYRFRWQESFDGDDDYWENLFLFTWHLPLH